jgi:Cu(I)/Ag(I) efflux system membrane protein CusA/SilA
MTFATMCAGLLPIMWSTGTGSEIMKRIAAPMVGGIFTSFVLELLVYPAIYAVWRQRSISSDAETFMNESPIAEAQLHDSRLVTLQL